MFDAPLDDAKVIVKALVGRSAGARYPRSRRGLLVEVRSVCLDSKKRFDIFVGPDAELPGRHVRIPETRRQRAVVGKFRVCVDQILSDALDVSTRIDLGKARDLFARQLKHADALPSVFHSPRRASRMSARRIACAASVPSAMPCRP